MRELNISLSSFGLLLRLLSRRGASIEDDDAGGAKGKNERPFLPILWPPLPPKKKEEEKRVIREGAE